jgi:hypothetical protein
MREIDRLITQLFPQENDGSKVLDLKFFPGEQAVTVEEFCKEVHAAFVEVDSGQSAASYSFPENLSPVSVDRFFAAA